ncbi:MAG TPA: hypothetical protein VN634_14185 [Candidatus Limnocylindrales bacterium]|nr:hypothetical protein [Candidatus Limnocylindrales bacterium]
MKNLIRMNLVAGIAGWIVVLGMTGESAAFVASSANDVCPPAADPCVIDQVVDVNDNTLLDFGPRTLKITGPGQIRFGTGSPRVRSGKLIVEADAGHSSIVVSVSDDIDRTPRIETTAPGGEGSMDIGGGIALGLAFDEQLILEASGDVVLRRPITISSNDTYMGELVVRSPGSIELLGSFTTSSRGGVLELDADVDVHVAGNVVMDGKEEAGWVILKAGRDITVSSDLNVRTVNRTSISGTIDMTAGRDLRIEGSAESPTKIDVSALTARGEAGEMDLNAGRELDILQFASLAVSGDFGTADLSAATRIDLLGSIVATGSGDIQGPDIGLFSDGEIHLGTTGRIEAAMELPATAADLVISAFGDLELDGFISVSGQGSDSVQLEGCQIDVGTAATIENHIQSGSNRFIAHHAIDVTGGARVSSDGGANVIRVRDAASVVIHGSPFDPVAQLELVPGLAVCAHCAAGQTACDDGFDCTADHCEGEACVGIPDDSACNDGKYCDGIEACVAGAGCVAGEPVDCSSLDAACAVGVCSEQSDSCTAQLVTSGTPCDDQDACTLEDRCNADVCMGRRDVACGDCGNSVVDFGEGCDEGEATGERGSACAADCQLTRCGHPITTEPGLPTATDALYVLKASIGSVPCATAVCDVTGDLEIHASDALLVLRAAVGLGALQC